MSMPRTITTDAYYFAMIRSEIDRMEDTLPLITSFENTRDLTTDGWVELVRISSEISAGIAVMRLLLDASESKQHQQN